RHDHARPAVRRRQAFGLRPRARPLGTDRVRQCATPARPLNRSVYPGGAYPSKGRDMTTPLTVSTEWLREHLGDADLVVVDSTTHLTTDPDGTPRPVSGLATYQPEHIPGALFADLLGDFADPGSPLPATAP